MPFYPLFKVRDITGFVNLANFSPNNWEQVSVGVKNVYSINSDGRQWKVRQHGIISENGFRSFNTSDFLFSKTNQLDGTYIEDLILFDMRVGELTDHLNELPASGFLSSQLPEWRATIGFKSLNSQTSYQGEILPTPPKATLLTFHPFIQFEDVSNYFIFLNIEKSPVHRWSEIDIYLSSSGKKIDTKKIRNNAANIIPLDEYGFTPEDLPVFYSKSMAGIPFGFAKSISTGMLSLEHTHPPGSLTIHGNRILAQRDIKIGWSNYLNIN
jgi:hypothetical protein